MWEELQSGNLWNKNHIHRKLDKMKRQRAMYQMKEQDKAWEKQLNEVEIGNLPEKRIQNNNTEDDPGPRQKNGGMDWEITRNVLKDLQELKNKQTEKNKTITEMKNALEGINNIKTEAEEQISELEDRTVEITAEEQNKEKRMKRVEDNLRDHWENTKCTNIWFIGIPEEEKKKKRSEKIFEEIIVENFLTWERKYSPKSKKHRESHTG